MRELLDAVPIHVDFYEVYSDLRALPGVSNVHDLHIWAIGGEPHLTAHIVADDPTSTLDKAQDICREHGVRHSTLQLERCGSSDLRKCIAVNDTCHVMASPMTAPRQNASRSRSTEGGGLSLGIRPTIAERHMDGCGQFISPEFMPTRRRSHSSHDSDCHDHHEHKHH